MRLIFCKEQNSKQRQLRYSRVLSVLFGIFAVIFFCSAFMIAREYFQIKKEEASFKELRMLLEDAEEEIIKAEEPLNSTEADEEAGRKKEEERIIAKYAGMSQLNEDYVGWLKISSTDIDYPVMYTPKAPEYYLRRAFDKTSSISGTPFIGRGAGIDSDCFIIYGHNMGNGSTVMFGTLDRYKEKEFWQENRVFSFYTATEKRTYEVFAAMETRILYTGEEGLRYYYHAGELPETDFADLAEWLTENSLYDTHISPAYGEQILILSTCSYQTANGRFIVAARQVNPEH